MDKQILAVIAVEPAKIGSGGGAPVFYAQNRNELIEISLLISKVLGAAVHDLHNDVFIVVRH